MSATCSSTPWRAQTPRSPTCKRSLRDPDGGWLEPDHFSTQPAAPVGFIVDDAGAGLNLLNHSLDASNLYGPSGQINLQGASVVWSFGDGTTASGVVVNHAFAHAGSYDVTATVTLASGALVQVDKTIAVQTPVALRADFNNGAQDLSDITNLVTVTPASPSSRAQAARRSASTAGR